MEYITIEKIGNHYGKEIKIIGWISSIRKTKVLRGKPHYPGPRMLLCQGKVFVKDPFYLFFMIGEVFFETHVNLYRDLDIVINILSRRANPDSQMKNLWVTKEKISLECSRRTFWVTYMHIPRFHGLYFSRTKYILMTALNRDMLKM